MTFPISLLFFTNFFKPDLNLNKCHSFTYAEVHINEYTCLNILSRLLKCRNSGHDNIGLKFTWHVFEAFQMKVTVLS